MIDWLYQEFQNPGAAFRGKPFWSWNGDMQEGQLRRQIRIMKRMGFGGFFMHSRVGLKTAYLSPEWFDLIQACCEEAQKQGMEAWLYDEDRWPSGAAGGIVTKDERFCQKRLEMTPIAAKEFSWSDNLLAAFSARMKDNGVSDIVRLAPGQGPTNGASHVLAFAMVTAPKTPWFNEQAYLDTLSHEAVAEFIRVTHEQYRERFGDLFGNVIPGMFTDEPNHESMCERPIIMLQDGGDYPVDRHVAWTPKLPEVFQDRYGYDVLDHLPCLFYDVDGQAVHKARHDYHDCTTWLFADAFARQIGDWCEQNNMMHTGHVLFEEPLGKQMSLVGSAMRFYEHMQAPGIDILTQFGHCAGYRAEYLTAKQCSSVARQMGRKWVLSELYGCTGWDFTFEGHKAVGDWQAALGINLRCPHLSWYTMQGEAKRDYPASILHQSPWWMQYPAVEDYFARTNVVITQGQAVCNVLVVNPIESAWQHSKLGWHERGDMDELNNRCLELQEWLLGGHIDFDYGDEDMLGRLATVEQSGGQVCLRVGQALYKTLVIGPWLTLRGTTVKLARDFAQAGGTVLFVGDVPQYVDAQASEDVAAVAENCTKVGRDQVAVSAALESFRDVSIADSQGRQIASLLYQLRRSDQGYTLFVCNTDRKQATPAATIRVRVDAGFDGCQEWDLSSGKCYDVAAQRDGDAIVIETGFAASASRAFVFGAQAATEAEPALVFVEQKQQALDVCERYALSEPNVVVLDRAAYRIGDGDWQGPGDILKIDQQVRDAFGIARRGGAMCQPWARPEGTGDTVLGSVQLRFEFNVAQLPAGPVSLALETPERFAVRVNGVAVQNDVDHGWWVDESLRLLQLDPGVLHAGANCVELALDFTANDNLEAIFVLGQFGVEVQGTDISVTSLNDNLSWGDWVGQRLPFYGGAVLYHCNADVAVADGQRVFLQLPDWAGACVRIWAEGQDAGTLAWPPYEIDVTDYVRDGRLTLGIEVVSHRRNCFGPLHVAGEFPAFVGPNEFITRDEQWRDDYDFVSCGVLAAPVLSYRTKQ